MGASKSRRQAVPTAIISGSSVAQLLAAASVCPASRQQVTVLSAHLIVSPRSRAAQAAGTTADSSALFRLFLKLSKQHLLLSGGGGGGLRCHNAPSPTVVTSGRQLSAYLAGVVILLIGKLDPARGYWAPLWPPIKRRRRRRRPIAASAWPFVSVRLFGWPNCPSRLFLLGLAKFDQKSCCKLAHIHHHQRQPLDRPRRDTQSGGHSSLPAA